MFDIEDKVIQKIAVQTKIQNETLSECFGLHKRELLFSEDYSNIIIPIYNNTTISGVLDDLTLIYYLNSKYNSSNIYLVVRNSNNPLSEIFSLFSHLYTELFSCKKYLDLVQISNNVNATKFVYNKSLEFFKDIDNYCVSGLQLNHKHILQKSLYCDSYPDTYKYCISSQNKNIEYLESIPYTANILHNDLYEIFVVGPKKGLYLNLYNMLQCETYVNIQSDSLYDYLAPYTGTNLVHYNTGLYNNLPILKHSISFKRKKIKRLKV